MVNFDDNVSFIIYFSFGRSLVNRSIKVLKSHLFIFITFYRKSAYVNIYIYIYIYMIRGRNPRGSSIKYECSIVTAIDVWLIYEYRYTNTQRVELENFYIKIKEKKSLSRYHYKFISGSSTFNLYKKKHDEILKIIIRCYHITSDKNVIWKKILYSYF